jgi:hypothetical protein
MQPPDHSSAPKYSFENDLSGRLFCWLIESGQVDYEAMIEQAMEGESDPALWAKRLADALKEMVGASWTPPSLGANPAANPAPGRKAPAYSIWFRPSPSKKIKFKEVASALLTFTGRLPPAGR